ncbi:unnamed protein product [Rhizoctonia solani]|uniref:Glycosyl transferase family 1 domain-containing protein n=1 Tax=Rhizoctonia solani TaxID=456999 RepID=A0A8H3CHA1_9AGAM|nr:unnamed protein product [Rhizoctonia solani]
MAHFHYLRRQYSVLTDGFRLLQNGNWTSYIQLPGSNNTQTEIGWWSVSRSPLASQTNFNSAVRDIWIFFTNMNVNESYTYDCNSALWVLTPRDGGTLSVGCLPNVTLQPYSYKAFVPVDNWVAPPPMLTRFSPGPGVRLHAESGDTNTTTIDIVLEFNTEMSYTSITNGLTFNISSSGHGSTPTVNTARFNGIIEIRVKNVAAANGQRTTGSTDYFLIGKGSSKNVMIFPDADYDNEAFGYPDGSYTFAHNAIGAEKFRYSWNYGENWTDWTAYEDKTTIPGTVFDSTDDMFWEGQHLIVQYWSELAGSSTAVIHADRGFSNPLRVPQFIARVGYFPLGIMKANQHSDDKGDIPGTPVVEKGLHRDEAYTGPVIGWPENSNKRRQVLISTLEYEIVDWKLKVKNSGLGAMSSLMGKSMTDCDICWVVPKVKDLEYPAGDPADPIEVIIFGEPSGVSRLLTFIISTVNYHGALAPLCLLPRVLPVCLSLHNAEFQGLWPLCIKEEMKEVCSAFNLSKEYVQFGNTFNLLHAAASCISVHQKSVGVAGVSDKYGKRSWAHYPALCTLRHVDSLPNPDPSDIAALDEKPRPELKRQAQELAKIKPDPGADLFVFVGRWSKQKGVDVIADAMPSLLEKRPTIQFIAVGPVIDLYSCFAAEKLARLMEMYPDRVLSKLESTALPPFLFSGANFALISSRDESFGPVAVEFGREGALGVGSRLGGLGLMPGWFPVESTSTNHMLSQFKDDQICPQVY